MPRATDHRLSPGGVAYAPSDRVLSEEQEAVWDGEEKPSRPIPPARTPHDVYALIGVTPDTVRAFRPRWDDGRARAWLVRHEGRLYEHLQYSISNTIRELLSQTSGHALRRDSEAQPAVAYTYTPETATMAQIRRTTDGRFYYGEQVLREQRQ